MTMTTMNDARIAGPRLTGLRAILADLGGRIERYRMYRRTLRELQHMSDRSLEDLGIGRDEAAEIAYRSVYGA